MDKIQCQQRNKIAKYNIFVQMKLIMEMELSSIGWRWGGLSCMIIIISWMVTSFISIIGNLQWNMKNKSISIRIVMRERQILPRGCRLQGQPICIPREWFELGLDLERRSDLPIGHFLAHQ